MVEQIWFLIHLHEGGKVPFSEFQFTTFGHFCLLTRTNYMYVLEENYQWRYGTEEIFHSLGSSNFFGHQEAPESRYNSVQVTSAEFRIDNCKFIFFFVTSGLQTTSSEVETGFLFRDNS